MKSRGTIPVPPAPLAWQDGLDHLGGICRKTLSLIRRVFGECMFGVKESNLKYVHGACILFVTPDVPGKPSYHLESLSFSFSSMLNSTRTQTASPMHSVWCLQQRGRVSQNEAACILQNLPSLQPYRRLRAYMPSALHLS